MKLSLISLSLFLTHFIYCGICSKILFSTVIPSHRQIFINLANLLQRNRHRVEFLSFQNDVEFFNARNVFVHVVKPELNLSLNEFEFLINPYENLNLLSDWCWNLLNDSKLLYQIEQIKFDVIIVDLFANDICTLTWAKKLGINVIGFWPWSLGVPATYHLDIPWYPQYDGSMIERITNIVDTYLVMRKWNNLYYSPTSHVIGEFYKKNVDVSRLYEGISMLLVYENPIFQHSDLEISNVISIGGFDSVPANPIPKNIENFVKNYRQGVVFVSLKLVEYYPVEKIRILENIFKQHPQHAFVWKRGGNNSDDPSSQILIVNEVNEQDILGYQKTRLFVTSCNSEDVSSAIFHGVPVLCIPMLPEQKKMAKVVDDRQIGLRVNVENASEEKLALAIRKLLADRSYYDSCRKLSVIFRDQPETPSDRFVFWVEYVVRHNGQKLIRPVRLSSSLQYYALDKLVLFSLTFCIVTTIVAVPTFVAIKVWYLPKKKGKVE